MKNYGFTGTRDGMTIAQHAALVKIMLCAHKTDNTEFKWHHGMCVGADWQCHRLAKLFDFRVRGHPPNDPKLVADFTDLDEIAPPKNYIPRNHDIVDESNVLIATPKEYHNVPRGSGTWATIRYATSVIDVVVIYPDGTTERR